MKNYPLYTLILLCFFCMKSMGQDTTTEKSDYEKGIYTFEQNKSLSNDGVVLEKLSLNDAIKKFGEPYDKSMFK